MNKTNKKVQILVTLTDDGNRANIDIQMPPQQPVSLREVTRILSGALMLSIKCGKEQDHVLMKETIDFLNKEFADYNSFADSKTKLVYEKN